MSGGLPSFFFQTRFPVATTSDKLVDCFFFRHHPASGRKSFRIDFGLFTEFSWECYLVFLSTLVRMRLSFARRARLWRPSTEFFLSI